MPIRSTETRFAVLAVAVVLTAALLAGCEHYSPEETLWRKHCADCHGVDGSGNTPRYMGNESADLLDNSWKDVAGDDYSITSVIRDGVFGEMPGNAQLSNEEVNQIISWLHHLRGESQ